MNAFRFTALITAYKYKSHHCYAGHLGSTAFAVQRPKNTQTNVPSRDFCFFLIILTQQLANLNCRVVNPIVVMGVICCHKLIIGY